MTPRDRAEECVRETLDGETGFAIDYIEQAITAAVATERERCAKIAEDEDELPGEPSETLLETIQSDPVFAMRAAVRATKRNIANKIRGEQ